VTGAARLPTRDPDSHGLMFLSLLGGRAQPRLAPARTGRDPRGLTFDTTPLDLRQAGLDSRTAGRGGRGSP
jgi:hypothetical protein